MGILWGYRASGRKWLVDPAYLHRLFAVVLVWLWLNCSNCHCLSPLSHHFCCRLYCHALWPFAFVSRDDHTDCADGSYSLYRFATTSCFYIHRCISAHYTKFSFGLASRHRALRQFVACGICDAVCRPQCQSASAKPRFNERNRL